MNLLFSRNTPTAAAATFSFKLAFAGSAMLFSPLAWGTDIIEDRRHHGDDGFTIWSNASNVTQWGLAAGVGVSKSPYKGNGTDVLPISLLFFDNKWLHVGGTTADIKIGRWHAVSLALRLDYAIGDGYRGKDAPILNGMQTRKSTFWYGPAVSWDTSVGVVSASLMTSGNKGRQASIDFSKRFEAGRFGISPYVGLNWMSHRYVDYYYGVRPTEVRNDRPAYAGKSAFKLSFGTFVDYHFTERQSVGLQAGLSYTSRGITNSPIVRSTLSPELGLVYIYRFK